MRRTILTSLALALVLSGAAAKTASAQLMPKAQVANLIVKVENGVDEFRKYLDSRAENASGLSSLNHYRLPGGASRLAALLIAHLCPISSLFAPCDPGAAPGIRY